MFLDEARTVARIRHRNVVQVHELVHEDDELFMVMEYLEGESVAALAEGVAGAGELPDVRLGAYVVAEACAGLHAAHEMSVIHRDVSPQNVLVTYDGEVKVIDFGIAHAADRVARTETGMLKGKLAYMSPEQSRGEPLDRRTDVFSLGIVLHELLTGRPLFLRASEAETLKALEREPIVPPGRVLPTCPPSLDAVCLRALARTPAERYATAEEMRRELVGAMADLPPATVEPDRALSALMRRLFADTRARKQTLLTRAEPSARRPATGSRRRRWPLAVGAAALVAAVAIAVALRRPAPAPVDTAAVQVSNFRAAWTTPNDVLWQWDVNDAPPDQFASYELYVGPTEADVRERSPRVQLWDARRNPELGRYLLPRTDAIEKVLATLTRDLLPGTDYHGQLVATDHRGRRSLSAIIKARTTDAADAVALIPAGCPGCYTVPPTLRPVEGQPGAYAARHCCSGACDGATSCFENFRVHGRFAALERLSEGAFFTTAFLEFAVTSDSKVPSAWSQAWLRIGDGADERMALWRFDRFTLPADGNRQLFQIPLRALHNLAGQHLTFRALRDARFAVTELNVGGLFSAGTNLRIDGAAVRW
jgi:hypothetical protein